MGNSLLIYLIITSFSIIHSIEVTSFLARISGINMSMRAMAYALQNSVFMLTRLFSMCFLPMLGYLVDIGIPRQTYLLMMSLSLLGASISTIVVLVCRSRIISGFNLVLRSAAEGRGFLRSLLMLPLFFFREPAILVRLPSLKNASRSSIFWLSALVFSIYSLSIMYMFYLGLVFPNYRMAISQLSGITNAFGAVLLTFFIEPKISIEIDRQEEGSNISENLVFYLLYGRLLGVGFISQIFILMCG